VFSDGSIELEEVELLKPVAVKNGVPQLTWGNDLQLQFRFQTEELQKPPFFSISIFDKEQRPVALLANNNGLEHISFQNGKLSFIVEHKHLQLSKGLYSINIAASKEKNKEPMLRMNGVLIFQVLHNEDTWPPFLLESSYKNQIEA